jgi:tetratricopeptide (TPR) repeat protein
VPRGNPQPRRGHFFTMATDPIFQRAFSEACAARQRVDYGRALEAARRALGRARELGDVGLELRAACIEGHTLIVLGRHTEALERLAWVQRTGATLGLEALGAEGVLYAVVYAHIHWVDASKWVGAASLEEGHAMLDRAEALLAACGRDDWRHGVLSSRATLMKYARRFGEAVALGAEAIHRHQAGAPGPSLPSVRQQHADVLYAAGRLESAEVQYMAILTDKTRTKRDDKSAWVGLARCSLEKGDLDEARRRADTAVAKARALGEGSTLCGPLDILCRVLERTGDLAHAAAVADQLVERARQNGGGQRLFHALHRQAHLAARRRDRVAARAWLAEAAALAGVLDGASGSYFAGMVRRTQAHVDELLPPSS